MAAHGRRRLSIPGKGGSTMRTLVATLVVASAILSGTAQAEKQIFIIANNSDGYGVDRCLASGASCGAAVATAYCQARDYVRAASFPQPPPRATSSSPSSAFAKRFPDRTSAALRSARLPCRQSAYCSRPAIPPIVIAQRLNFRQSRGCGRGLGGPLHRRRRAR